jgi:hypothetical protein
MRNFKGKGILTIVIFITSLFLSGEHWVQPIAAALLIYYFFFVVNLFQKRFSKENWLTKIFFDFTKTPFYLGSIIIIAVFFIGTYLPQEDVIEAYVVAAIGAGVSLIGILKRRNGPVRNKLS